jgi:hypothetical protein
MKKSFLCALGVILISQIYVGVAQTLPPKTGLLSEVVALSVGCILQGSLFFLLIISMWNGLRVYLLVRKSKSISSIRAKKISVRLIGFSSGISIIIIGALELLFDPNAWGVLLGGYLTQLGIMVVSLAMILSFTAPSETPSPSLESASTHKLQTINDI